MRFDIQNQLCRAQAFTGAATVSAYAYKKQSAAQDLSIGRQMCVVVYPTVASGAGTTHTFEVVETTDGDTAGLAVLATAIVLAANMQLGDKLIIPIPQGSMTKQYLGLRNSASGGTTTITVDAYLMPLDEVENYKSFPKVVNAAT